MYKHFVIYFLTCSAGWSGVLAQDQQNEYSSHNIQARHLHKRCRFGHCGGAFGNGFYGGFGGNQGGYYPGNQYPYPPINIGISQSQSSASGGYGGYYPNYNQYNGYQGYPNYGFGYNRPFFGNGYGPQNNQFNGNYYLANTGGGYGLTRFGDDRYDSDEDYSRSAKNTEKERH